MFEAGFWLCLWWRSPINICYQWHTNRPCLIDVGVVEYSELQFKTLCQKVHGLYQLWPMDVITLLWRKYRTAVLDCMMFRCMLCVIVFPNPPKPHITHPINDVSNMAIRRGKISPQKVLFSKEIYINHG